MQRIPLMPCWHLSVALLARLMCVSSNCPADRGLYCICNYTGKSVPLSCGLVTLFVSTEKGHAGKYHTESEYKVFLHPPLSWVWQASWRCHDRGRQEESCGAPWTFNLAPVCLATKPDTRPPIELRTHVAFIYVHVSYSEKIKLVKRYNKEMRTCPREVCIYSALPKWSAEIGMWRYKNGQCPIRDTWSGACSTHFHSKVVLEIKK